MQTAQLIGPALPAVSLLLLAIVLTPFSPALVATIVPSSSPVPLSRSDLGTMSSVLVLEF